MNRHTKAGLPVLAALVVALLQWPLMANAESAGKQSGKSANRPGIAVTSATVQESVIQQELIALGALKASQSVNIAPRISGQISRVNIPDGQNVRQGDVLVELDSREQQAKVKDAQVALADARRQLKSMETLFARNAVSKDELDAQQAQVDRMAATLESQTVNLSYHTLTAPFTGTLGFTDHSTGALVSGNEVITTLDDLSTLELTFELPEQALRTLAPNAEVIASTTVWPDEEFVGTISAINPRISSTNLTITSKAVIANSDGRLRPGMLVQVRVLQAPEKTLSIPARSVLFDGNQQYVYVIDKDSITHKRLITPGLINESTITVKAGLAAGEQIVEQGVVKVSDGTKVSATQRALAGKPTQAGDARS
ncbi:efflux RND transporter periplasmic adaptor subunit [Parendozoicomonas haliclonae]|nr:efflux RND transporter periplasmic adaptor subunit [Parendozoicomonas haliclonae]